MDQLQVYLPADRRYATARDHSLPDRMVGAVSFAGVSGFAPLTLTT